VLEAILPTLSDYICQTAERRSYGLRQKDSIIYDDESEEALWYWEIINTSMLPISR
jgi:hypothetical protein